MKKAMVIVMMLAAPAMAETPQERCIAVSNLGGEVMKARQAGLPLETVLKILAKQPEIASAAVGVYKTPRYHTEENKQAAIVDFRNDALVSCLSKGI
jgi:hypothetical protein